MKIDFKTLNLSFCRLFQDILKSRYDFSKTFFFNLENCFFFVILKPHISIQHPKYKHPHLKYENLHQELCRATCSKGQDLVVFQLFNRRREKKCYVSRFREPTFVPRVSALFPYCVDAPRILVASSSSRHTSLTTKNISISLLFTIPRYNTYLSTGIKRNRSVAY